MSERCFIEECQGADAAISLVDCDAHRMWFPYCRVRYNDMRSTSRWETRFRDEMRFEHVLNKKRKQRASGKREIAAAIAAFGKNRLDVDSFDLCLNLHAFWHDYDSKVDPFDLAIVPNICH